MSFQIKWNLIGSCIHFRNEKGGPLQFQKFQKFQNSKDFFGIIWAVPCKERGDPCQNSKIPKIFLESFGRFLGRKEGTLAQIPIFQNSKKKLESLQACVFLNLQPKWFQKIFWNFGILARVPFFLTRNRPNDSKKKLWLICEGLGKESAFLRIW